MINFLRSWSESIIICIFVALIIEMLVPNGDIKKYVRVIIGIYIVFVILNPIISNIKDIDLESFFEVQDTYSNYELDNQSEMASVYKTAIETQIKQKVDGIQSVKVSFSEDLENIDSIEIVADETASVENIKSYIKENFDIQENAIYIAM